jgi:hypothetical protein
MAWDFVCVCLLNSFSAVLDNNLSGRHMQRSLYIWLLPNDLNTEKAYTVGLGWTNKIGRSCACYANYILCCLIFSSFCTWVWICVVCFAGDGGIAWPQEAALATWVHPSMTPDPWPRPVRLHCHSQSFLSFFAQFLVFLSLSLFSLLVSALTIICNFYNQKLNHVFARNATAVSCFHATCMALVRPGDDVLFCLVIFFF